MKIAVDIRPLMNKNYSGIAEYTYQLLKNLLRLDRKNQYLLFYNSQKDVTQNLPQFTALNAKIIGFHYPNKILNLSLRLLNYPQIDKLLGGIDLFFLPNNNFLALSKDCKQAITVHDLSYFIYPHFYSLKHKLWHMLIDPKKIIFNSPKIIADSTNTKTDLIKYYQIPKTKIKVIPLGIDHDSYRIIDNNQLKFEGIKKKYNLPDKFLFFLGTLEPRKNIEGLISAFNLLKANFSSHSDLHLVIAGQPGWQYQRIFNFAAESPYNEQIHFLDYVSSQDKPYLYNLAELFIFPSFYEGFGLPPLEAQACGTPVIAGLNSSFPEILADSALLIKPDHLEEIVLAANQILTDQPLKQKLITSGLANSKRFSWTKCAQETLDYLTSNN